MTPNNDTPYSWAWLDLRAEPWVVSVPAVTDGRYTVDPALARPGRGRLLQSFVFQISIAGRAATLLLRPGFVTAEFIDLAGKSNRGQTEEAHLDQLKAELAQRVLAAPAEDVYDLAD